MRSAGSGCRLPLTEQPGAIQFESVGTAFVQVESDTQIVMSRTFPGPSHRRCHVSRKVGMPELDGTPRLWHYITTSFWNCEVMLAADSLSRVLGALADPTRRSILARLAKGDATVAEVAAPFPMSQPAISKHLKVLEAAGLVTRSRRATARLSHLEAKPLQTAAAWIEDYQRFWADSFDALEDHLTTVKDTTVTNKEQE